MDNVKEQREKAPLMTYKQIAEAYSMGISTVTRLARESGALVKIGKLARVDPEIFYHYIKTVYQVKD